jgi:hypothetical protein
MASASPQRFGRHRGARRPVEADLAPGDVLHDRFRVPLHRRLGSRGRRTHIRLRTVSSPVYGVNQGHRPRRDVGPPQLRPDPMVAYRGESTLGVVLAEGTPSSPGREVSTAPVQ